MLMRAGTAGVPTISEWLTDVLSSGSNVGIDPFLFSSDATCLNFGKVDSLLGYTWASLVRSYFN